MRALLISLALLLTSTAASSQQMQLTEAAEQCPAGLVRSRCTRAGGGQLPGSWCSFPGPIRPSPWGRRRRPRCSPDFMVQGEEVETVVRAAREVEPGRGYVELHRSYRIAGTQDVRTQSLLLGYRLAQHRVASGGAPDRGVTVQGSEIRRCPNAHPFSALALPSLAIGILPS